MRFTTFSCSNYLKRVITHPLFKNIGFAECQKILENAEAGECVIRPSTRGFDHLTVSWKITDGVYQHVDVLEEGKENQFSLGRSLQIGDDVRLSTLSIVLLLIQFVTIPVYGTQEYEDLDEIKARYIDPMAAFVRDVTRHKYYRATKDRGELERQLAAEKSRQPNRIPYFMSPSDEYPGRFRLAYQPKERALIEWIAITPHGYRYRDQVFPTMAEFLTYFKEHYTEKPPSECPPGAAQAVPWPTARGGGAPISVSP